jgi:hypothetical protein
VDEHRGARQLSEANATGRSEEAMREERRGPIIGTRHFDATRRVPRERYESLPSLYKGTTIRYSTLR